MPRYILFLTFTVALLAMTGCRLTSEGIRLSRNFYEVDPGKLYRSAQLSESEFDDITRQYGIKTIINLQGEHTGFKWYDDEKKIILKKGLSLIDIPMATENIPRRESLIKLLNAFKTARRPILIHCRSGADRTGEASAIYEMEYMGKSRQQALDMLSFRFYHVPVFTPAEKYFIQRVYQDETWARLTYDHCDFGYNYADRRYCSGN